MALTSSDFMAAPGLTSNTSQLDKLDVSDVLAAILLKDTSTLSVLGMGAAVKNTQHFWIEDSLNSCVLSASLSFSSDNVHCFLSIHNLSSTAAVQGAIRSDAAGGNAILRIEGAETGIVRVTGSVAGYTLSVVPYGSLTAAGSAFVTSDLTSSEMRLFVVGNPYADESDYSEDISQARLRRSNYTQVFERAIRIAETREHIALYAVTDELKHQIKMRTYEIKRELNNAVLNSVPYVTGGAYTDNFSKRTMAGIVCLIRDPDLDFTKEDNTVNDAAGGALTITRINNLCNTIYGRGGFDDQSNCCIIVGAAQARVIALLEEQRIRKASNELIVGSYANKVKTDLGFELPVVLDRFCPNDVLIIVDKPFAKLCALSGDAWHLEKMSKTGRTTGYQLSGQYTLELRNAAERHGLLHGLAFTL